MIINVTHNEFKEKWYVAYYGKDTYTNGSLKGIINYEDDNYVVIKLINK